MITYADFMTLMFALVASLYSISLYHETRLEGFVQQVSRIFNPGGGRDPSMESAEQINRLLERRASLPDSGSGERGRKGEKEDRTAESGGVILPSPDKKLKGLPRGGGNQEGVAGHVRQQEHYIEIELDSNILFESGNANLSLRAIPLLRTVADTLMEVDFPIRVEGYTDNIPIHNELFASNWELSVYRSSRVVRELVRLGVNPYQLSAAGHGSERPVADNQTAEGRNRNRRVVIVVNAEE